MATESSELWKTDAVLNQLREQAGVGGTVAAHVFLFDTESGKDLADTVRKIVDDAAAAAGAGLKQPSVGRVFNLAKSFSLTAEPAIFVALARNPKVKSILPSRIADVYPKPIGSVPRAGL